MVHGKFYALRDEKSTANAAHIRAAFILFALRQQVKPPGKRLEAQRAWIWRYAVELATRLDRLLRLC